LALTVNGEILALILKKELLAFILNEEKLALTVNGGLNWRENVRTFINLHISLNKFIINRFSL
jgi:hypothetical protein